MLASEDLSELAIVEESYTKERVAVALAAGSWLRSHEQVTACASSLVCSDKTGPRAIKAFHSQPSSDPSFKAF